MKTLALIFTLTLTLGAFASEDLALSECTKGNDDGRVSEGSSGSIGDSIIPSTSVVPN